MVIRVRPRLPAYKRFPIIGPRQALKIRVPVAMHAAIKELAAQRRISISEATCDLLAHALITDALEGPLTSVQPITSEAAICRRCGQPFSRSGIRKRICSPKCQHDRAKERDKARYQPQAATEPAQRL